MSSHEPSNRDPYPTMPVVARWCWHLVGIAAAAWIALLLVRVSEPVLLPVLVGLLIAALLHPLASLLRRVLPAYLASGLSVLTLLAAVVGISWLSGTQLSEGIRDLIRGLPVVLTELEAWVEDRGLGLSGDQAESIIERAQAWLTDNSTELAGQVVSLGSSAMSLLTATLLALITAFFLLADGRGMWLWLLHLAPARHHRRTDHAALGAWTSLTAYIRTQTIVAAVDAAGIGLGAWLLGLPYVGAITLIVFLAAFVPIIGAVLSGALAVVIALADAGTGTALIMLAIVVAVQQLESNVLQPVLMGKAVSVHPFAVIVGVSLGFYIVGIAGALLAVPLMAVVKTGFERWGEDPPPLAVDTEPDDDADVPRDDGDADLSDDDVEPKPEEA